MTNYYRYLTLGLNFIVGETVNGLTILLQYESQSNMSATRTDGIILQQRKFIPQKGKQTLQGH